MTGVVVVCVKAVPLEGGEGAVGLDPVNEVAVEWALRCRDGGRDDGRDGGHDGGHGGAVVAVTMGPAAASDAVRKAVAMGCDTALQVIDPALAGASVGMTAQTLAGAVSSIGARLAVFGHESLYGSSGAVPAAVSAILGWPLLSFVRDAVLDGDTLRAERDLGRGPEVAVAPLPAVLSLAAGTIEPRYPRLQDVLAARTFEIPIVDLAGLGVVVAIGGGERVLSVRPTPAPARIARVVNGDGGPGEILALLDDMALLDA